MGSTRNGVIKLRSKNYINSPFKAESAGYLIQSAHDILMALQLALRQLCEHVVTVALHPIPSRLSTLPSPSRDTNPAVVAITVNVLSIEATFKGNGTYN